MTEFFGARAGGSRPEGEARQTGGMWLAVACSLFGGVIFGYDTGVIAGVGPMAKEHFGLSSVLQGVLTSSIVFGGMIGSVFGGEIADRYGRRLSMAAAAVLAVACPFAMGFIDDDDLFGLLVAVRTVLGLSVGLIGVVVPMYVSEVVPADSRERFGTVFQFSICLGILLAYAANFAFCLFKSPEDCYEKNADAWQYLLALGSLPGLGFAAVVFYLAESPRWLRRRQGGGGPPAAADDGPASGRDEDDADKQALLAGHGPGTAGDDDERGSVNSAGRGAEASEISWSELLRDGAVARMGLVLAASLQATGINTIIYYAPDIFCEAGMGDDTLLITMSIGAWNFATALLAYFYVDRFGRKKLYLVGLLGMSVCSVVLAAGFFFFEDDVGPVAVTGLFAFIAFFEIGPGSLFWGIVSDLYGVRIRGKFSAYVNFLQWLFNLFISLAFPPLLSVSAGNGVAFAIFAGVGVMCILVLQRRLADAVPAS